LGDGTREKGGDKVKPTKKAVTLLNRKKKEGIFDFEEVRLWEKIVKGGDRLEAVVNLEKIRRSPGKGISGLAYPLSYKERKEPTLCSEETGRMI